MGLLDRFKKAAPELATVIRLPSGSFTIDAGGRVVVSTLPRAFPEALVRQITEAVQGVFRGAREANLPLSEVVAQFAALKLTAREMRGGAIIFLAPRMLEKK